MSEEAQHARLGPSNHRWPNCPGSIREEARYPDIAGEAAVDGTGSHLLLELCLQNNVPAAQYEQQIIGVNHHDSPNGWMVLPDRIKRVQMCLDYVSRRVNELKENFPGCVVTVESECRSDPGSGYGRDDWWGTVDITIMSKHPMDGAIYFIEVCDYKDGRGYVSEKKNTQLISYLFGKMLPYIRYQNTDNKWIFASERVEGCRMTIVQPKTTPVVRYQCSTRIDDMLNPATVVESANGLAWAASLTDDPDAVLISGKHCQWCKANPKRGGHCTAATDKSLQTVENMNTELVTTGDDQSLFEHIKTAVADPSSLTVERLSELADAEAGFQAAFDKVKKEITDRLEQGIKVPGYEMQPGPSKRVWIGDEDEVVKKLKSRRLKKDDIYPAKLISPAAVLKLDKLKDDQKARIEKDMISVLAGKLVLKKVAHRDTNDVESNSAELMFADVPVAAPVEEKSEPAAEVSFF